MTSEQYKEYSEKYKEIEEIKRFLECGCGILHNKFQKRFPFSLIIKERHERKFVLFRKWHLASKIENEFEISTELQQELIKTIEKWIDKKEKELLSI